MSSILCAVGPGARGTEDEAVSKLLDTMAHRGGEKRSIWRCRGAFLATARDRWEMGFGFAGPTLVGSRGPYHAVCDATLYYREDLEEKLRRVGLGPASGSAAHLILAAFEAFGEDCVEHLEGDFAFCLWDARSDSLFCARDPFGMRSLFYGEMDGTVVVASTPHPLVKLQGERADFDGEGVLRSILMRHGDGRTTAWRDIREVPAGHALHASRNGTSLSRYWRLKRSERWTEVPEEEAVSVTARLLRRAVCERREPGGTALAMSGGMDSTSLAACYPRTGHAGSAEELHLLSFRLPEGDPGNEDWYVARVADYLGFPVRWIDVAGIGFFADVAYRARHRSNCHGHLFEGHNRSLAGSALESGARVLLNGHGGDNVFAVEDWMMADLLRRGRLVQLRRFMSERGYRGLHQFLTYCLRPALPYFVLDLAEVFLGRRICSRPYERPIPPWVVADEDLIRGITRTDRMKFADTILRDHPSVTGRQRAWAIMDASFQRACSALFDLMRDEGVELRLPFYDRRVVEFALSRPARELNQPGAYKVLLGRAMEGRLPDRRRALEPSGFKPGSAIGLLRARWSTEVSSFMDRLSGRPWISAEMGIVDPSRLARDVGSGRALEVHRAPDVGLTLFVEAWLRANVGASNVA